MASYFTIDEIRLQLSPAIYERLFGSDSQPGFGQITNVSGALRFAQMAEQASGYVDAFLEPAGYQVPVAAPSAFIKRAAMYRFIADVYALAELPINQQLLDTVNRNDSILYDIATGKIPVPGETQDPDTGTGGNSFTATTGSLGRRFSRSALGGSFF